MQIFVSWSGHRSKLVASALKEFLPEMLESVTVWMSAHDLGAGDRWSLELSNILSSCDTGIACLTRENLNSSWLLFESGAISKTVGVGRLIPLRLDMPPADVQFPLAQFQNVGADVEGIANLAITLNRFQPMPLPEIRLARRIDKWGPELLKAIDAARSLAPPVDVPPPRSEHELLTEVLSSVRTLVDGLGGLMRKEGRALTKPAFSVFVDTRALVGAEGRVISVWRRGTSNFLDAIYFEIAGNVSSYSYGIEWVLQDSLTKKLFCELGREYCESQGHIKDTSDISTHGISSGSTLEVVAVKSI